MVGCVGCDGVTVNGEGNTAQRLSHFRAGGRRLRRGAGYGDTNRVSFFRWVSTLID